MKKALLVAGVAICAFSAAAGQTVTGAPPAPPAPPVPATPPAAPPTKAAPRVEEIVVTSTRRRENVLKVPYNITAISGATLKERGVSSLADLRNQVPGLVAADYGNRGSSINNNFIIRGVNTNDIGFGAAAFPNLGGATVSNYIDETPFFVNLRLTDIERVEVLRGPQGTLYGAGSVGGTVRSIHNKPDPTRFDYYLDTSMSGTDHADRPNASVDAMVNVPITDRLALRLNGGYDLQAGFIDANNATVFRPTGAYLPLNAKPVLQDPSDFLGSPARTTTLHGINRGRTWYARGDLLARINDDITAELAFQHQDDFTNGFSAQFPGSDYVLRQRIPLSPAEIKTDLAALTLTEDFGFATITSSSSYYNVDTRDLYDNSGIAVYAPYYYGAYPRSTLTNFDFNKDRAFTQEVRLVSPKGEHYDWVAGVYFQNRRTQAVSVETVPGFAEWANTPGSDSNGTYPTWADRIVEYYGGTRPGSLPIADINYDFRRDVQFTDLAGFGELTVHLTPRWHLTGGVRVFRQNFRQTTIQHIYNAGTTFGADSLGTSQGTGEKETTDKIFKANMSYNVSDTMLAYFTFSQGFRAGGANAYPIGTCYFCDSAAFTSFTPDTVDNYEIGVKGTIGRFRYSAAAYNLDWQDIQIEVGSSAGTPIILNGGSARSTGLELEGGWRVTDALTLSAGYAYVNPILTQDFSSASGYAGKAGALLPGVSRHQMNGALDWHTALAGHDIDWHVDGSYRSGFNNQIQATRASFRHLSGYAMFNASVQTEVAPNVKLQLFARNLFNARGVSAFSERAPRSGPLPPNYVAANAFDAWEAVSRPLTVGLRLVIRR